MILDMLSAGDRISDRLAIQDCLNLNVVAADLLDVASWKSTYWEDADEEHGWYSGNAHQFIDETVISLRKDMDVSWHLLGNTVIRFAEENAHVVTYFYCYCRLIGVGGNRSDSFSGGRYIDRFEKRGDRWKIKLRITKADWVRSEPDSFPWGTEVIPGFAPKLGTRDPSDPGRLMFNEMLAGERARRTGPLTE